ncbi:cell division protein FtsZ [Wohlfahrtiimonas populi]|uniref:cell division protein FtsZ n=1 Tax=Wohlfahrtiimonas populi TaxID=1940240 RepID=UPI00098D69D3|nr:cell division protein FtsZ [Wohlfahrtiimonas populi]
MPVFELHQDFEDQKPIIKIIGVGGAGGNAVTHMVDSGLKGVNFLSANTDSQALKKTKAEVMIQLGSSLTKGLGAGANPEIGRQAALEDKERIKEALDGANMVFVAAGMGGGTGTGAAPVIAETAREMGILTVAVVSRPFSFEGKKRENAANAGLKVLAEHVDSLITIPNERLLTVLGKTASLVEAFAAANNVLYNAVQGISESIIKPGLINLDFNDVKTVMSQQGMAMMGVGSASGDNRAREATQEAIASPLLDNINLAGAKGILVNITGGAGLSIGEYHEVGHMISEYASEDATVIIGTAIEEELGDELRVTIIATGLDAPRDTTTATASRRRAVQHEEDDYEAGRKSERRGSQQDKLFGEILDIPAFLRKQSD